jgi:two-component system, cell cycle sensor histidine kinase PleC
MTKQLSLPFGEAIDREAEALVERYSGAAWLVAADERRIVAASAIGAAMLRLGGDREAWRLDAAMPAARRLGELARAPAELETCWSDRLLFWTPQGARELVCEIRRLRPAEQPALLLVTATASPSEADTAAAPAMAPRTDAETLELIARRIRDPAMARATDPGLEAPHGAATAGLAPAAAAPPGGTGMPSDVARLAHELKTPLSAIAAAAEIMRDERFGPLGNERYRDYAADISHSARHALAVVAAMLRAPGEGEAPPLAFAEIDVNDLAERCASAMRPLFTRAGLDLSASLEPRLPHVIADAVSVRQIVLNLLTNALKFGGRGGQVEVATRYDGDGPVTVWVRDTGPGMGQAALGAATEGRAAPGPGETGGLGLGLPLVRALAEANGARMAIDSAPRQGTRVEIIFPKDRVVPI